MELRSGGSHTNESAETPGSFLRWAGSKRKLLPYLIPLWKAAKRPRYVEPFVGSGALFFSIKPELALISDANTELILTYRTIRDAPHQVLELLQLMKRGKRRFLHFRDVDPVTLSKVERAARFVYLNRYCFNGLYRTNQAGHFNVPYAGTRTGRLPEAELLLKVSRRLKAASIHTGDFADILKRAVGPQDFVYLDPPYAVSNRRIFRQYDKTSFGIDDLQRLSDLLYALDALGARFVVSYALCAESLAFFRDWRQMRTMVLRNIAGFASKRRKSIELLVTNVH
jgi:DNA adenine methylase